MVSSWCHTISASWTCDLFLRLLFLAHMPIPSHHMAITKQEDMAVCQNLVPLVNIKIAGKWMFIPLKMVLIGIDPYPYHSRTQSIPSWLWPFSQTEPQKIQTPSHQASISQQCYPGEGNQGNQQIFDNLCTMATFATSCGDASRVARG